MVDIRETTLEAEVLINKGNKKGKAGFILTIVLFMVCLVAIMTFLKSCIFADKGGGATAVKVEQIPSMYLKTSNASQESLSELVRCYNTSSELSKIIESRGWRVTIVDTILGDIQGQTDTKKKLIKLRSDSVGSAYYHELFHALISERIYNLCTISDMNALSRELNLFAKRYHNDYFSCDASNTSEKYEEALAQIFQYKYTKRYVDSKSFPVLLDSYNKTIKR